MSCFNSFLKSLRVKFPKLTYNVDNFPNPMGPRPCTKKDSDSPGSANLTEESVDFMEKIVQNKTRGP